MTLDLFGHADEDFGTLANYFLPNLARAQVQAGHNVVIHLLTSSRSGVLSLDGIDVTFHRCVAPPPRVGQHRRFGRQLSLGMLHAISGLDADVIHFHGVRNCQLMFAAVAQRTARIGIPLVAQDQGSRDGWFLEDWAFHFGLRRVSAVIAGNDESAHRFEQEGVPAAVLHTIPNGYDPKIFFPDPTAGPPDTTSLRILLASRLTPEKDPLTAVEASAAVAATGGVSDVTLIGTGTLREEVETRLRSAVERLVVRDRVPQSQLGTYYRAADVLLLTSLGEGSNQTVVEAMACGLPVIATDVRGIRDVVEGAGILVPPGDVQAIAAALQRVAGEPTLRQTVRERGLERAKSLTWDAIAQDVERVYDNVAKERA